jgi:hypothetical protein
MKDGFVHGEIKPYKIDYPYKYGERTPSTLEIKLA